MDYAKAYCQGHLQYRPECTTLCGWLINSFSSVIKKFLQYFSIEDTHFMNESFIKISLTCVKSQSDPAWSYRRPCYCSRPVCLQSGVRLINFSSIILVFHQYSVSEIHFYLTILQDSICRHPGLERRAPWLSMENRLRSQRIPSPQKNVL